MAAVVVAFLLALAVAACSDSSDGGSHTEGGQPAETTAETSIEGPPDRETSDAQRRPPRAVATLVEGMYRDLATGNAAGVCSVMSEDGREQIAQQAPGGSVVAPEDRTCEDSLTRFLDAAARSGVLERTLNATVEKVEIDGRTATATVAFDGASGQIELVRERGTWRFGPGAVTGAP